MPTGYTQYIENGKITTGKDFLKLCTRAFDIAVDIKDEPLSVSTPTHFKPDSYYKERYEKALKRFNSVSKMTLDEARQKMKKLYDDQITFYIEYIENATSLNEKYKKVRNEVEKWTPPTEDHQKLKEFALNQIDMCMIAQDYIDKYIECSKEKFDDSDKAVNEFIELSIKVAKSNLDTAYESWQTAIKRCNEKNEYMRKFLESIGEGGKE